MNIAIITATVIIGTFISIWVTKLIQNNTKKVSFQNGMFPQKTGRYYIILNDTILTTDFYNADKHQWVMTKNPTCISHFAEYGDE